MTTITTPVSTTVSLTDISKNFGFVFMAMLLATTVLTLGGLAAGSALMVIAGGLLTSVVGIAYAFTMMRTALSE